jgi:hypothetical protein
MSYWYTQQLLYTGVLGELEAGCGDLMMMNCLMGEVLMWASEWRAEDVVCRGCIETV